MGMTKEEFMSKYINDQYKKKFEQKKKERAALLFVMERSYKMNKRWNKRRK